MIVFQLIETGIELGKLDSNYDLTYPWIFVVNKAFWVYIHKNAFAKTKMQPYITYLEDITKIRRYTIQPKVAIEHKRELASIYDVRIL